MELGYYKGSLVTNEKLGNQWGPIGTIEGSLVVVGGPLGPLGGSLGTAGGGPLEVEGTTRTIEGLLGGSLGGC